MINKTELKKLKKVLKRGFMNELINKLNDKQMFTVKGESFKKPYLSNVLNGRESNISIEQVIFELYNDKKNTLTKMNVTRKKILENKKPEAGTPGNS
jgi:hypothetical protein